MVKEDALNIARKYAGIVTGSFPVQRMILFGSYAKGNFNKDSDIDIAVILKEYDDSINMQLELMRLRRKIDSRIEPHPFKEEDFTISNPLVFEILKYGKEIKM